MREGEQASPELRSGDLGSNDAGIIHPSDGDVGPADILAESRLA